MTDLVDGEPVVEALAPAVEVGVECLRRDPALRFGERERSCLIAVDRDVPFLLERRRRTRHRRGERSAERAGGSTVPRHSARCRRGDRRRERCRLRVAPRSPGFGRARIRIRHAFANGDHIRAVLAADLQDLAAHPVVTDRVAGLATIAEELHRSSPTFVELSPITRRPRRDTFRDCAEKNLWWQRGRPIGHRLHLRVWRGPG